MYLQCPMYHSYNIDILVNFKRYPHNFSKIILSKVMNVKASTAVPVMNWSIASKDDVASLSI